MKLLKILLFIFAIYFIRRFIQLYRVMKKIQEEQLRQQREESQAKAQSRSGEVVDAEYKVIK